MTGNRFIPTSTAGRGGGRLGLLAAAAGGITAVAVLAVLAGSPGSSDPPEGAPGPAFGSTTGPAGAVAPDPDVDLRDAEQVCAAFAAALFTVTEGDGWPYDAYRRAAAYTTGELAAAMATGQGRLPAFEQRPAPGGVEVTAYIGDHMRPDTDGTAYRAVLVTVTDRSGTTAPHIVYCTLHTEDGWLVAAYERERSLP